MLFSPQLALRRARKAAAASVSSLTLGGSATSATSSITCPAGVQSGDIIVVLQFFNDNSVLPSATAPSGFTQIATLNNAVSRRALLSYKKATGSEASTSLTGMTGTGSTQYLLYYFRPNTPSTTLTVQSNNSQYLNSGDPTAQTVAASGHTPPLIVIGGWIAGSLVTTRTFTVAGSDAKDGEINELTDRACYLAYKLYSSSPADVTVDMADFTANYLFSCDITVA